MHIGNLPLIRKLIPTVLLDHYRAFKRLREQKININKTVEQVFTNIYMMNKWGGDADEFCSGSGSTNELIVSAYISTVSKQSHSEGFFGMIFVDLGCGDFRVSKRLIPLCSSYIGVDIVKPLVLKNQDKFADSKIKFMHLDILSEALPDGDVCFVRQVFQHLSNNQVNAVLVKLKKYKWVFITEHYPADNPEILPNKDKVHGADIRLYDNSGIYLNLPPFNLPIQELQEVLKVSADGVEDTGAGIIRTFLWKPQYK